MAEITAKAVNELRIKMGVGLMDCKRALVEADGDEEKEIKIHLQGNSLEYYT